MVLLQFQILTPSADRWSGWISSSDKSASGDQQMSLWFSLVTLSWISICSLCVCNMLCVPSVFQVSYWLVRRVAVYNGLPATKHWTLFKSCHSHQLFYCVGREVPVLHFDSIVRPWVVRYQACALKTFRIDHCNDLSSFPQKNIRQLVFILSDAAKFSTCTTKDLISAILKLFHWFPVQDNWVDLVKLV